MSSFKDLRIVDNFYQTSAFFPMPTLEISTIADDGTTSLGSYSLCFPYYVAGKSYYGMILECRNSSNTARHLLKRGRCALNFIEDDPATFKEAVRLGFPGETSAEKMKGCRFALEKGLAETQSGPRPLVVSSAFQVFECTWDDTLEDAWRDKERVGMLTPEGIDPPYRNFNGITSKFGCHFILKIDKILMKPKQYDAIINGVSASSFPKVPVDYGYRDNTHFWYSRFRRPRSENIPASKEADLQSVMYACNRADDKVKFTKEAAMCLVKVPRIFLKTAVKGCVDWAKEHDVLLITEENMQVIRDKRAKEK